MDCPFIKGKPEHDTEEDRKICLNCPYPECIHEYDTRYEKPPFIAKISRDNEIKEMSATGVLNPEIAHKFKLGTRHIRRIVNGK